MTAQPATTNALGSRIVIVGPSCSGKSTLGAALADRLSLPFIELDALFWRENWTRPADEEFCALLRGAHSGEGWVSAGNYLRQTVPGTWPLADTIIWLDVGLATTSWRVLRRSWRRWRSGELLWGVCRENFWRQLALWDPNQSLIRYNMSRRARNRELCERAAREAEAAGKRFLRLRSRDEIARLFASVGGLGRADAPTGP
ncbi:MAG: adenylate kinase [Dehalococcoidia bacterium]|nr:adenylate kinase [Dehalococcoidia bacterium]